MVLDDYRCVHACWIAGWIAGEEVKLPWTSQASPQVPQEPAQPIKCDIMRTSSVLAYATMCIVYCTLHTVCTCCDCLPFAHDTHAISHEQGIDVPHTSHAHEQGKTMPHTSHSHAQGITAPHTSHTHMHVPYAWYICAPYLAYVCTCRVCNRCRHHWPLIYPCMLPGNSLEARRTRMHARTKVHVGPHGLPGVVWHTVY